MRPFMDALEAYVPGEQPSGGGWVKLNTNEFPYPAAPEVIEAIRREAADTVRVYPDPTARRLREALAARHGVHPEQILAGNGSDEILRLLAHAFLGAGRRLAVVRPTYTLYEVLAAMFEAQVDVHPLEDDEQLPESLFAQSWDACFLPVPNPPLGTVFPDEALERLAARGALLVLDGAYVDFSEGHEPLPLLERYPNVVLTRTFSKSAGLAGMRVGYMIGDRALIEAMHKLRDSYNVNRVSQAAALAAVAAGDYYAARAREIVHSRRALTGELRERGFHVHESRGNFVFARHPRAPQIYEELKERRILVRYFRHSGLEDGMRITIGTHEENRALVEALDQLEHEREA
jgi:histidinol-phosphate aminotransferase